MVNRCSPPSDVIKATTFTDCLDKVEHDHYDGVTIPDTLMRCVSKKCQARGINVDDEYVISYGDCIEIDEVRLDLHAEDETVMTYVSQSYHAI